MFLTRALSGIVLVIIALATILAGDWVLLATLLLISLVAIFELTKVSKVHTEGKRINWMELAVCAGTVAYYAVMYFVKDFTALCMVIMATVIVTMVVYVFAFPKYHATQTMASIFSFLYAPVMLSFVYMVRMLEHGVYLVWIIFLASWISDTCAYLVGITIGKHKYLPKLSPKKSIEGSIGGILGSALLGWLFGHFLLEGVVEMPNITWILVLICAIGSVISQIGDLAASAIKRNYEIKDYGKLIPGHGGIMDRFDSVIFTAPIIYFLCYYLIH